MPQGKKVNEKSGSKKRLRFWRSKRESSSQKPPLKTSQSLTTMRQQTQQSPNDKPLLETPQKTMSTSPATPPPLPSKYQPQTTTHTFSPPVKVPSSSSGSGSNPPAIQPSTPSTLPPTPSPRRNDDTPSWQQADSDIRTRAMRRLHELGQEHSKNVSPDKIPPPLLQSKVKEEENDTSYSNNGREQKIIDAVLGLHPCVAVETKDMIRGYASKPTSPMTVVNLEKIQKGGNHLFDFARRSMGKLMNCAADLKDLHEADGLCAWEDGGGDSGRGNGRGRRQYSSDDDDEDDILLEQEDGEVTAVSAVEKARESSANRRRGVGDGVSNYEDSVGSLEDVMGTLDVDYSPSKVLLPSEHQYHTKDLIRQTKGNGTSGRKIQGDEIERKGNYLQLEINGAASGLTSLKALSEGGSPKQSLSKYEIETANPTTSNVPFDERSDPFEPVDLYASSAYGDSKLSPRKLYTRGVENRWNPKPSPGKSFKLDEEWSVCTDEREF